MKKKKKNVMGMKSISAPPAHVIVKRLGLAAEVVPYIPPEERQQTAGKRGLQVLYDVSKGESRQNRGKADRRRRRGWNRRQRFLELPRKAERFLGLPREAERREDKREGERRSGQEEVELPTSRLLGKVKVGQVQGRRGRMLRRRKVGRRRKRKSWYQTTFF